MSEVRNEHTPPGAWPWGKGKETHQETGDIKSNTPRTVPQHNDNSEDLKKAKDKATDTGPDDEQPIEMNDDEKPPNYTTGNSADNPEITEEPEKLGDEAKDQAPHVDEDEAKRAGEELQQGVKAGQDDDQQPLEKPKQSDDLESLSDEMKAKLTPGKGVDLDALLNPKKPAAVEEKTDEATKSGQEATDKAAKTGEETTEDVSKEGKDTSESLKEGESLTEGKDLPKDGDDVTKQGEEAVEGKDLPKEGEEAVEGKDLPKEGEDVAKQGEEAVEGKDLPKEGEEITKEGQEAVEGKDLPKEGEDVAKEGEEALEGKDIPKEGEDVAKEGEEALEGKNIPKEGEDVAKEGEETLEGKDIPKEGEEALNEGEDAAKPEDAVDSAKEGVDVPAEGEDALKEGEEAAKEGEDTAKEGLEEAEPESIKDLSGMRNGKVNKGGNVINQDGKVVGRIVEGALVHLVGKRVDENGQIWNDSGKIIGKADLIPDDELEAMTKEAAPFESFPDAVVDGEGYVVFNEERIGKVVDGDAKKLRGMKVDPDGDILDRAGNVVGKAERWEPEKEPEPEPEPEKDRSILAGKRVNKAGNVVDGSGVIFGRVVEGDPKRMVGRMCNKMGEILSESGDVIGRAEVVPEGEREGMKEGPFAELEGCTVTKEGKVVTPGGDVVGRLISGDPKVLFGRLVDEDGDVCDKNGNVLGKAERWSEPEVEKRKGPMAGRRVNREGNVVDEDGNLIGKLTTGELSICAGKEIDDDGDVVDSKGKTIGHCSLLSEIPEPKESDEDKAAREKADTDRKLAQQMAFCLTQCLDKVKPICSMITQKIEAADRKPKEELDEEELVKEVRPLIEEGGKILQEANGIIRGLDPDGRIQANAKHKTATHEASPEEYHLADILKELTQNVTTCIDNAKKKLEGMPHAKKELSPLWGLLSEPLFQILAAVGLLLNGVLGLVGRLLSGLGLGGLVDSLLGGLGVKNILEALGVGSLTDSLTGKNQKGGKKKGGLLGLGG